MKIKTSITLSERVLSDIDQHMDGFKRRSDFIEIAARHYLTQISRQAAEERDRAILDAKADRLNREAEDVLDYQVAL